MTVSQRRRIQVLSVVLWKVPADFTVKYLIFCEVKCQVCCDDASVELVDKLYYLGDVLSIDGDADDAVEARL